MIKYNKEDLVERVINQMSRSKEQIAKAAEIAKQSSIEAEGAMQTRYGSEKEECGYLADGLNIRMQKKTKEIITIRLLKLLENPDYVTQGTLVRLKDIDRGELSDYLILPYGGGETIETNEGRVTVVTSQSPLLNSMINLKIGDEFSFIFGIRKKNYKIVEII